MIVYNMFDRPVSSKYVNRGAFPMEKCKENMSFKRIVEKLEKHGVHAELVKPRAKLSVYQQALPRVYPFVHKTSLI